MKETYVLIIYTILFKFKVLAYISVGVLSRNTVPIFPGPPSCSPHFQSGPINTQVKKKTDDKSIKIHTKHKKITIIEASHHP